MSLMYTTPTPNQLYDTYLPLLSGAELKVLLVIIRQTYGWIDKRTGKRKKRDRITIGYFKKKTGLSSKSISKAINGLSLKGIIIATTASKQKLLHPTERKGKGTIFYTCCLQQEQNIHKSKVKSTLHPITKSNITKETHTKERESNTIIGNQNVVNIKRRLTDWERYLEIIQQQKNKL